MRRSHASPRSRVPIGFRLWFAFVGTVMLCIWGAAGYIAYSTATDPEGTGRFIGRVVGGVVDGATTSPTPRKVPDPTGSER